MIRLADINFFSTDRLNDWLNYLNKLSDKETLNNEELELIDQIKLVLSRRADNHFLKEEK